MSLQGVSTCGCGDAGGCVSSESVSQLSSTCAMDSLCPNTSPHCNAREQECTSQISTLMGQVHAHPTQLCLADDHHLQRQASAAGSGVPLLVVPVASPYSALHTDGLSVLRLSSVAAAAISHTQISASLP